MGDGNAGVRFGRPRQNSESSRWESARTPPQPFAFESERGCQGADSRIRFDTCSNDLRSFVVDPCALAVRRHSLALQAFHRLELTLSHCDSYDANSKATMANIERALTPLHER